MSTGSQAIGVAKPAVGGGVLVAPIGTTLPTDYATPLPAAFRKLGYVTEDGVTRTVDADSDDIIAWGGDAVGDLPGNHTVSYGFSLLESANPTVLEAIFGSDNVDIDEHGAVTITGTSKRPPRAVYVIETDRFREVIYDGQISVTGDTQFTHTAAVTYETTVKAYPDANGVKYKTYRPADA